MNNNFVYVIFICVWCVYIINERKIMWIEINMGWIIKMLNYVKLKNYLEISYLLDICKSNEKL